MLEKREKVVEELLQTEQDYIKDLQMCVLEIMQPLQRKQVGGAGGGAGAGAEGEGEGGDFEGEDGGLSRVREDGGVLAGVVFDSLSGGRCWWRGV